MRIFILCFAIFLTGCKWDNSIKQGTIPMAELHQNDFSVQNLEFDISPNWGFLAEKVYIKGFVTVKSEYDISKLKIEVEDKDIINFLRRKVEDKSGLFFHKKKCLITIDFLSSKKHGQLRSFSKKFSFGITTSYFHYCNFYIKAGEIEKQIVPPLETRTEVIPNSDAINSILCDLKL
jgi:hypothetical protein